MSGCEETYYRSRQNEPGSRLGGLMDQEKIIHLSATVNIKSSAVFGESADEKKGNEKENENQCTCRS